MTHDTQHTTHDSQHAKHNTHDKQQTTHMTHDTRHDRPLPVGGALLRADDVHVAHVVARVRQHEVIQRPWRALHLAHVPRADKHAHLTVGEEALELVYTQHRSRAAHSTNKEAPVRESSA